MKKILYTLLIIFCLTINIGYAQLTECGCTNCPLTLPDGDSDTLLLNILGVQDDNLASPTQGVCGIRLTFEHEYIGDLTLTLISPSGQEIQLIGPSGFYGPSDNATYDLMFIPCSQTPVGVYPDKFNSEVMTGTNIDFEGSFWPSGNPLSGGAGLNCLEELNTGPVNGTWKIFIKDNLALDAGVFVGYEIILCDPTGLSDCNSNPCAVFAFLDGPDIICEGSDEDITLDASASTGDTFIWSAEDGGSFDGTPSGSIVNVLTPGTYNLTVTQSGPDAGDCQEILSFNVPPFIPSPEISITPSGPLNCLNPQITLESDSNIPSNQSVEIWIKDGDSSGGQTTTDLIVTEPGEYELTVIDFNSGCFTSEIFIVTNDSAFPTALAEADGPISCIDQVVELTGSSNEDGFDYSWDGPDNFTSSAETVEVMIAGTYNLTVTNAANGCSEITMVEVMADTLSPDFSVEVSGELDCSNLMTTISYLSNEAFTSFEWTGPNNYSNSAEDTPLVEFGGIYTLIVTNANGCTATNSIEVIQSADVPDISTVDDGIIDCNIQDFALSGSSSASGATYTWSGPNNFTASNEDAGMVSDTGTYTLTVSTPNGCSISRDVFVTADTISPVLTLDSPTILGCGNINTTLTSTTTEIGLTYQWDGPNGQTFTDAAPAIVGAGTYNVIITAENGCQNNYSIEVIADETMPDVNVSIDAADILTCNLDEVTVQNAAINADYTYAWTGPNSFTSADAEPILTEGGMYMLTVTGPNGCTNEANIEVAANLIEPDIDFTTNTITCTDNMVSIGVSSTANIIEYTWTGVNGYTSNQQNPSDISSGGEYTAIITAENGCTNMVSFMVEASMDLPDGEILNTQGNTLNCTLTSISLVGSSNTTGATFSWLDPAATIIPGGQLEANTIGEYTLIITSPNGCSSTQAFTVEENISGPMVTANPNVNLDCIGDVALSVQSSENIVSYEWLGPNAFSSNSTSPMVGLQGTYDVILTGENGCTSTSSVEVIDMQLPPSIFVDPTKTLVCGQNQIMVSGGSTDSSVAYNWTTSGGSIVGDNTTSTINVNAQGTYTLTVTNLDTGCEITADVEVDQDNNTPDSEIVALQSQTINCNFTSITLDANGSDNGNGFTFDWGNDGGTSIESESTLQATITASGTYFITVTNTANQCTSIASIEIGSDIEAPQIELSNLTELTCTETALNISNIAQNTANNLTYNWQTTQGGNITSAADLDNIQVDMPGSYILTVVNSANGCETEMPFVVMQNIEEPVISAGQNATLNCGVQSLTLNGELTSGESDISIIWDSPSGSILSGENTFTPEIGLAGTYTLTVTNNINGCSQQSEVTIEPNMDLPVIAFAPVNDFTCSTTSLLLDAGASSNGLGITYTWTNNEGADIFGDDTATPEIFEPGEYILTISDANNNCESTSSIIVSADTLSPSVLVGSVPNLSCTVDEVNLSIDSDISGLDIQWSALTGNIVSGASTVSPIVNQAGEYQVIVTSTTNQCTAVANILVELDANTPAVDIAFPEEITCDREQIILDAGQSSQGANISILWENMGGNILSGENGLNPIIDMPGTYTLTISDDINGCVVSQSVTVLENKVTPEINIDQPDIINCTNQTITVQALNQGNSDYTYLWETSDGNIVNGEDQLNPEFDAEGSYILTATDTRNGCIATLDIIVEQNITKPEIVLNNTFDLTCPSPLVSVDGVGSSTGTDFIYTWTDESDTELFTTLEAEFSAEGLYTLNVLNTENGCTNTESINIEDLRQVPNIEITTPEVLTCMNPTSQLVALDLNNQNLEYTWEDFNGNVLNASSSDSSIGVDQEGDYTLFVVDPSNGCEASFTVNVSANQELPEVLIVPENNGILTCEETNIELTGSLPGLSETDVTINWTTVGGNIVSGQNTLNPVVNAIGTYTLIIIDINSGCTNEAVVSVTADDLIPLATLNEPATLNCITNSTLLSIPVNTGNNNIVWTFGGNIIPNANNNELEVTEPGEYAVVITNLDNGCNSMDIVSVQEDIAPPEVSAGSDFELQCNIQTFQILATSDGNSNYIFDWDAGSGNIADGAATLNPLIDAPGLYTVAVTNAENGCITTDEVLITENEDIPTALVVNTQNPLCEDDLGALDIEEVVGGVGPFSYSIDGGITSTGTSQYTDLTPGSYQLSVIDDNGCQVEQNISITPAQAIGVELIPEIELLLGDSATLSANLTNIDPNDIQFIQWTPATGLSCDDCLNPTTSATSDILYTLEVFLGSGCSAVDEIQLRVDRNFDVFVPNAFSPFNGDQINDVFHLFAKENVVTNISSFSVYDRWGTEVFMRKDIQPNDEREGWTGTFRNEDLSSGVYVYVIVVEFKNGITEILQGDVTLMK